MELVDGQSLDQLIKSCGSLEARRSVAIVAQVLSALGFAPRERDRPPRHQNHPTSWFLPGDQVKVADFRHRPSRGLRIHHRRRFIGNACLHGARATVGRSYRSPHRPVRHRRYPVRNADRGEAIPGQEHYRDHVLYGKAGTGGYPGIEPGGPRGHEARPSASRSPSIRRSATPTLRRSRRPLPMQCLACRESRSSAVRRHPKPGRGSPPMPRTRPRARRLSAPYCCGRPRRDLATFVGPMASIAVKRAVRNASDLLALYELLGRQVANPKDRAEFLARGASARRGGARPGAPPARAPHRRRSSDNPFRPPNRRTRQA